MLALHSFTLNFGFSLRNAPSLCYERIITISNPKQKPAVLAKSIPGRKKQCGRAEGGRV